MPMSPDNKQNLLPGGATISKNSPHISDWPLDQHVRLFIAAVSTDDYTTKKQTFSSNLGCFRNCFLVVCKEFMWKMTVYAFHRPIYALFSL